MGDVIRKKLSLPTKSGYVKWDRPPQKTDGVLVEKRQVQGQYGEKTDLVFRGVDGGADFIVSASTAQLREAADYMEVGQRWQIEFVGTKPVKGGSMKVFDCYQIEQGSSAGPAFDVNAEPPPEAEGENLPF